MEIARRVYAFVSSSFEFRLGATLFGTSREALRRMRGDCSEAAVLTAALLRALGIPSRIILGFATTGGGVFIGHAWTEARIAERWVGLDAALREFPAGAERLALLRPGDSAELRIAASNLMLNTLSNLEIEIEGAWSGGKSLPLREIEGGAAEARAFFEEILRGIGR
jgi:transglutaminase-like putative cysteine protease